FLEKLKNNDGTINNYLIYLKTKTGEKIPFETNSHFILKNNNIIGIEGIIRNITQQQQDKEKIEAYARQLEEANKTKDRFFNIIAHDLKNPINSILGLSDMLVQGLDQMSQQQMHKVITYLNSAGKNTFKLLENLLDWSRAQTGTLKFLPKKCNAHQLITDAIANVESNAIEKNITIITNLVQIEINADANMLTAALRNLLSNAIKFTHNGGHITVTLSKQNSFIKFEVIDNGIGMSKETVSQIFELDKVVSTNGTNNEKGTGLGILLCKEFVEKHGGKILAKSEVGKGTTFTILIPTDN
ncbi:MAG: sensor histidine kinase, partial [Bacteroidia bacterium]